MSKDGWIRLALAFVIFIGLAACSSKERKQRQIAREQVVTTSKFYCEFINGEKFSDLDVMLNISMADKCDTTQHFSVNQYRTASEIPGVLYCCNLKSKSEASTSQAPARTVTRPQQVTPAKASSARPQIPSRLTARPEARAGNQVAPAQEKSASAQSESLSSSESGEKLLPNEPEATTTTPQAEDSN